MYSFVYFRKMFKTWNGDKSFADQSVAIFVTVLTYHIWLKLCDSNFSSNVICANTVAPKMKIFN